MPDKPASRRRKVLDKLILIGVAVAIVAPIAVFYSLQASPPAVCQSADDLDMYPADEELIVSRGLSDADAAALDRFEALRELQLHYSHLSDAGMAHVGRHTGLLRLVLYAEDVTDAGLAHLGELTALEDVSISACSGVTAQGLFFLADCEQLTSLLLYRLSAVDDGLGPLLGRCRKLQRLELQSLREVSDLTVAHIVKLPAVTALRLELCPRITAASVDGIVSMSGLQELSLLGVDTLKDSDLAKLARLKSLRKLDLPHRAGLSPEAIQKLKADLPECEINL